MKEYKISNVVNAQRHLVKQPIKRGTLRLYIKEQKVSNTTSPLKCLDRNLN